MLINHPQILFIIICMCWCIEWFEPTHGFDFWDRAFVPAMAGFLFFLVFGGLVHVGIALG